MKDDFIDQPLVSVGIPSYNRPDGLRRALECITKQTYPNLEIIVSDNCSTDFAVKNVLQEFSQIDRRVSYIIQPENKGAAFNFQYVLDQATGEYFMWASDDDWWDITFIDEAIAALKENQTAVACWSDVLFYKEENNALDFPDHYELYNNPDLSSCNTVSALLKYHFQYGWYGFYALYKRTAIIKACHRHYGKCDLVFGFDVHVTTEILLTGNILKLHKPLFNYSTRMTGSADYHLPQMPFGQGTKNNPYLAFLLEIFNIIMRSASLTAFEKISYFSRFLFIVIRRNTAIPTIIRRYPSGKFYRNLLCQGNLKELLVLIMVEMAVLVRRFLIMLSRWIRKCFRTVQIVTIAFKQLAEVIKFTASLPPAPRALIVEPNICHAEVLPSLTSYLMQLGYNCQLLVSCEIGKEKPFHRIPKEFPKAHYLTYSIIMKIITSRYLIKYDFVILSSSFDYRKLIPFVENYRFLHKPKHGMLFIEHNLNNISSANPILYQEYEANRLLVLTNYYKDERLTEIYPCYFGNIKTRDKKNDCVIILVAGTTSQDIGKLVQSTTILRNKGLKDFEIRVIGRSANVDARAVVELIGLGNSIKLLGRVDYSQLYREIEESDFLVGPQATNNYLNQKTSGSKQLSIGFTKPMILTDKLASAWGFNASNCISYSEDQGLVNGIVRALSMQNEKYSQMTGTLRIMRENVYKKSLQNLSILFSELAQISTIADAESLF